MTTLPFDANLDFDGGASLYVPCEVDGYVTTDDGTSNPYFRVEHVRLDGSTLWHRPARSPVSLTDLVVAKIAATAAQHSDILPEAMRIEGWDHRRPSIDPDALREFRDAAE